MPTPTTPDKGGGNQGFRPHELLEAALATCMNIHLRMYAANHGIELGEVTTKVTLDRSSLSGSCLQLLDRTVRTA